MIVAERKPLTEIMDMTREYARLLVIGCKGCVTVCNVGGLKEVEILASLLRIARRQQAQEGEVMERLLERQCDPEYIEQVADEIGQYDAVVSLACGVGPQFLSEAYPESRIFPGVNTTFMGGAVVHGVWEERCAGCGTCAIHRFDGLCPIARCAKSLMNGPCGGSAGGNCEINPHTACIWDQIVQRKMARGRLNELLAVIPPKDWSTSRHGGPRRRTREDLTK